MYSSLLCPHKTVGSWNFKPVMKTALLFPLIMVFLSGMEMVLAENNNNPEQGELSLYFNTIDTSGEQSIVKSQ